MHAREITLANACTGSAQQEALMELARENLLLKHQLQVVCLLICTAAPHPRMCTICMVLSGPGLGCPVFIATCALLCNWHEKANLMSTEAKP